MYLSENTVTSDSIKINEAQEHSSDSSWQKILSFSQCTHWRVHLH